MFNKSENINRELFEAKANSKIELFEIYEIKGSEDVLRFHGGLNEISKSIIFDSKEYYYIPCNAEGFESRNDGKISRPTIKIINFDGFLSKYIKDKDDLLGAKIKRIRTFIKFLDKDNFLNYDNEIDYWNSMGINPDPESKLRDENWVINQKMVEDKFAIQFELSSSLDLENVTVPKRKIINNYCYWKYRGRGCEYKGDPIADSNDVKFTSSLTSRGEWEEGISYNQNDFVFLNIQEGDSNRKAVYVCTEAHSSSLEFKPTINSKYWTFDSCSKTINGCCFRFKGDPEEHLPFGGFPGSRIF